MAIHEQQTHIVEGGFAKTIDEGSVRMVLDNLQRTQYNYPEKSTIRELTSNAIDAIRERDIAVSILTGKTTVEDHYVEREGSEYKDSKFNKDYYDLKWLSKDPNVYITYKEGSPLEKDQVIIKDYGVGLGNSRLMGYFSLAYSTKRLSRFGLGKYGIGAKAALSTGVPFYVVRNRYNGLETCFNVSSYDVIPAIPKLNTITGQENPSMDLGNGTRCYYLPTDQPNGLEIILEVKKHHKQKYIDAVKSQLLYFDHVLFNITAFDGKVEALPVKARILYEDEIMILSDNKMYNKPHILINRVNYGNIDFQELELEDKIGNISIKMKPEEVTVSPSREHVMWDDMTRNSVVKRFKEVQVVAEKLLQGELEHTDFIKWMKACIMIRNKISTEQSDTLIARLARIVDLRGYIPIYKPDPQFKLDFTLFTGMKVRKITGRTERQGSEYKFKIDRSPAGFSDLVDEDMPVLIQQGSTDWLRDRYLLEDVYQSGFITIWLNETTVQRPEVAEGTTEEEAEKFYLGRKQALERSALDAARELKWYNARPDDTIDAEIYNKAVGRVLDRWNKLNQHILASEGIQFYDTIEVPDTYKNQLKGQEAEDGTIKQEAEVQTQEARLSAEARRKLEGKTILFTPRLYDNGSQLYEWHKLEIPATDIDKWNNPEVFYSSDDDSSLLQLAAFITRPPDRKRSYDDCYVPDAIRWSSNEQNQSILTAYDGNTAVKLVKVAQNRVRYYQDFKHIRQFFAQVNTKTKTITMSNALIRWNTARYIHERIKKLAFMSNFEVFHQEHAQTFRSLLLYCNKYYREVGNYANRYKEIKQEEYDDMVNHLNNVTELQLFVRDHPDDSQAIANLVKQLFGVGLENQVTDACGIDIHMRDQLHKLLEYAEPIAVMLNQMPVLTSSSKQQMDEELEQEIRNFIQFKQGS